MANSLGDWGEKLAADYLIKHGWKILARNFHSRYGEIDIISCKGGIISFVEVKTRREHAMVSPMEAITPQKQHKMIMTSETWLLQYPSDLQPRFDAIGIEVEPNDMVGKIQYLEDAFGSE
mgnify:FL=1